MKTAASIIGLIAGGISGLVAFFASYVTGPAMQVLAGTLTVASVASVFGGAICISAPVIGGTALMASAVTWAYIWYMTGSGPTYFSAAFMVANGLAGALALSAMRRGAAYDQPKSVHQPSDRSSEDPGPTPSL